MMRRITQIVAAAAFAAAAVSGAQGGLTDGMKSGDPAMESIGALTFGPEGILFATDPKAAAVVAIATGEESAPPGLKEDFQIEGIDRKVAALLGAPAEGILINDLAVDPGSHAIYLSVSRGRGPDGMPALVKVPYGGEPSLVDLSDVKYSKLKLADAPEDKVTGEGRRRRNKRMESITDIAYLDGQVAVAGLSNEEFASTLRTAPFPFEGEASSASVEIFHGAHGRFETASPIRTFLPMAIDGEPNIVASYTCTPLVRIPVKELKPKAHVKGVTVAELGNRNRPLDMIEYEKDGERFILMANSSRGVMKVDTKEIGTIEGLTERVTGGGSEGLPYETIEDWKGVVQLDKLGDAFAVVVRKTDDGAHHLAQQRLP